MGDNETVVAQTSDPYTTGTDVMDADNAISHGGSGVAGKSEVTDVVSSHEDLSGNFASVAITPVDSSQLTAYHSSVNGNDVSDGKTLPAGGVSENGVNSYDVHNSESANQQEGGSGIFLITS